MRDIYLWTDWFTELAQKIAAEDKRFLIDRARQVEWRADRKPPPLLRYGDENIDPFSFFYALAQRNQGAESRGQVYPSVKRVFNIEKALPVGSEDAFIFPTPPSKTLVLFHKRGQGNPQLLWRLFREAVEGLESVEPADFDGALDIGNVGKAKLTQALFLMNPSQFIPCDDKMNPLVALPNNAFNWALYREWLRKVRDRFPGCEHYEINLFAYLRSTGHLPVRSDQCFHVSTNAWGDEGGDFWNAHPEQPELNFEQNNWVFTGGPGLTDIGWDQYHEPTHGPPGYPLREPNPGDIVLVRTGLFRGRGIGIVYRNDYQDHLGEDSRIHVVWVNKTDSDLAAQADRRGFNFARGTTLNAFRQAPGYTGTFSLLGRPGPEDSATNRGTVQNAALDHPLNQILYGPPGTGKTYHSVARALAIIDGSYIRGRQEGDIERFKQLRRSGQIQMVTFHQSYAYEDFIEGIRPVLDQEDEGGIEYELRDGIFKQIADAASKEGGRRFVLIIDEINRGNIAKIFGELITLIEASRRIGREDETEVALPYSTESFGVPDNLYLIGTMNTADRSIQLLDTALRRRFDFMEMMPEPEHELISQDVDGVNCQEMLRVMNDRITALLDREHQIGHTYLMGVGTMDELADAFRNRIFPLLQEYFFDDWPKIRAVLGRNEHFVQMEQGQRIGELFDGHGEVADEAGGIYRRLPDNHEMWTTPDQYRRIYETQDR